MDGIHDLRRLLRRIYGWIITEIMVRGVDFWYSSILIGIVVE